MLTILTALACSVETAPESDTADFSQPEIVAMTGDCGTNPTPEGEVMGVTICGAPDGPTVCRSASWQPQADGSILIADCTAFGNNATWTVFDLR